MQIEIFEFQSPEQQMLNQIRTVEIEGEIWFVASDVAKTLGYSRPSEATKRHCKEKGTSIQRITTLGGEQPMTVINEPNVYRLIIKSQLPSAEKFEEWLFEEVIPSIRKKGYYGKIDRSQAPNFYLRYKDNLHKIDRNYFSVISELFVTLNAELEKVGYEIPNKAENGKQIMPDISVGRMFSNYLKKTESEFNGTHKYYDHSFSDKRQDVEARMYPIEALAIFRKFVFNKWIPENAQKYFKERDPVALDYLPKLLGN
jgi:prophage antirepressor-like protein